MIASVRGTVAALRPDGAVVQVGGVGVSVQVTPGTAARLRVGEPASLSTSLVVREDSLTLYGFADDDERGLFELLQTASGVGPRLAQAVLTVHTPDAVRRALLTEDLAALTLVPGIGRKGAQRMVLELRDRVDAPPVAGVPAAPADGWRATLSAALTGLGFPAPRADEVVAALAVEHPQAGPEQVPVLLREALARLGGAR